MILRKTIAVLSFVSLVGVFTGCSDMERGVRRSETLQGALIGTGVGAAGGALIGEAASGEAGKGALIGAGVGAATGTAAGYAVERGRDNDRRDRWD